MSSVETTAAYLEIGFIEVCRCQRTMSWGRYHSGWNQCVGVRHLSMCTFTKLQCREAITGNSILPSKESRVAPYGAANKQLGTNDQRTQDVHRWGGGSGVCVRVCVSVCVHVCVFMCVNEDSSGASIYPGYRQVMHVGLCRNVTSFDTQSNMHRLDFSVFYFFFFFLFFLFFSIFFFSMYLITSLIHNKKTSCYFVTKSIY